MAAVITKHRPGVRCCGRRGGLFCYCYAATGQSYHRIKSNSISLKDAAVLLEKCAPEKKGKLIVLMREVMQDTERLLVELETRPQG